MDNRGSPPHARGGDHPEQRREILGGITPARAGRRPQPVGWRQPQQDHPRTRGEEPLQTWARTWRTGSPPHARGGGGRDGQASVIHGITPARAGRSNFCSGDRPGRKDHPRTRGEERPGSRRQISSGGSPPHARGGGCPVSKSGNPRWITPARAGRSYCSKVALWEDGDHPRTRGEETLRYFHHVKSLGSPPHARGGGQRVHAGPRHIEITPARAGRRHGK